MNPYALAAKLGGLLLILALPFWGGCRMQARHEAAARAKLQAKVMAKDAALGQAATVLRGNADLFRAISATTRANAAAAKAAQKRGADAVKAAQADATAAKRRIDKLETDLLAEKHGCADSERPICGVPLR